MIKVFFDRDLEGRRILCISIALRHEWRRDQHFQYTVEAFVRLRRPPVIVFSEWILFEPERRGL